MGLSDRIKELRSKAEDAVVEHKDQIQQTVQKVGQAADQRTGGKYSEQIERAGAKASGFVEGIGDAAPPSPAEAPTPDAAQHSSAQDPSPEAASPISPSEDASTEAAPPAP